MPGQNSESEPESRCRSALDGSIFHVIREQLHLFQKKNRACADNVALFANVGMHVLIYWPEDKVRGCNDSNAFEDPTHSGSKKSIRF